MAEETCPPLSVLLVDPRAGAGIVVKAALEGLGHRVAFVHDWPAAESRLTLHHHEAVVMCVTTPGQGRRSAAALLRAARPAWSRLPLVGLVPGGNHQAPGLALAEGCDGAVPRPVDAAALDAALRRAVAERAPPMLIDAPRRAALRASHGPAALAALDADAMELAARLVPPLLADGGTAEAIAAAGAAIAAAMDCIGAPHAAAAARAMTTEAAQGRRAIRPVMGALTATRSALRQDRLTAARQDPIWAASDRYPGEMP